MQLDILLPPLEPSFTVEVNGLTISWDLLAPNLKFAGIDAVILWTNTSLAELIIAIHRVVGAERYGYILQAEGRRSVAEDWQYISSFPNFEMGLREINRIALTAGWGSIEVIDYQPEQHHAVFRIYNAWEAIFQRSMGVCWGTHYLPGKIAGWFGKHTGADYWLTQQKFLAKGDPYDEFVLDPSSQTLEQELQRIEQEEQERQAELEVLVKQRTNELEATVRQLEEAQEDLQRQARALEELSIPIVKIWDGVLMVSLIGALDSQRAQHLTETLLVAIGEQSAVVVILDITGVPSVDAQVANYLLQTVQATRLLGTEAVLVGISPEIAQALVQLGVDLRTITTYANLQKGLQRAFQTIGFRIVRATS